MPYYTIEPFLMARNPNSFLLPIHHIILLSLCPYLPIFQNPAPHFTFFLVQICLFFLKLTASIYIYYIFISVKSIFFVFVKQITSLTNVPKGPIIEVTSKSVRMKKPRDAAKQS